MSNELFTNLLDDFKKLFKQYKKVEYVPNSGDKKAIGLLIANIKQIKPGLNSAEMREACKSYFEASFNVSPKWIKDNITLRLINSQFNTIRASWKSFDPVKQYNEENLRDNYNRYGNKKTSFKKSEPTELTEIMKRFVTGKNIE